MGGSKDFISSGGFTELKYDEVGITANDLKIIRKKSDGKPSTPTYSNTPYTTYAKESTQTGLISQLSVYGNGNEHRAKAKDIDIEHAHTNPDKKLSFNKNEIHVHEYDENGIRSKKARKPSKKERRLLMVARYGKRKS